MSGEELDILRLQEVRQAIEENIERDPLRVALDNRIPHAREVATQVKYLQRARQKLRRMYEARCILPQRAFEQASSEQTAAAKRLSGGRLLDLTCGLGIDSTAMAERFESVVAIERDEVLAEVVRENLRRQGIDNVEVVTASAEEYVAACKEQFDWVYVDPDRRTDQGRRVVRLEDCSPNVVELWPALKRISSRVAIKNSPLFDVEEAFRLFGRCGVEVLSLAGECKEVMIYADGREPALAAEAVGKGRVEFKRSEIVNWPMPEEFAAAEYSHLIIPDVALQKARLVRHALHDVADVWSENSFGFARTEPRDVLGRVEEIARIEPFDMKALKRELKGVGTDITMRDFPHSLDEVRRRTGMRSGSEQRLALTRVEGKCYTIYLK
ncbi:MAG: methyltransferase domain-containing protein [Alistipes sp.]|nr:methyltransferase domain-containing protein [Alistipes sp.]